MSDLGFEVGPVDSWNGGNPWSISRRPRRRRRSGAALPLEGGSSFQIRPPPPPPFPGRKPWPFWPDGGGALASRPFSEAPFKGWLGVVDLVRGGGWRRWCSIPLVADIGGGVWVLPHPLAAPRFVCWLVTGRQWASVCSARSGRRGDSGLSSGSGPRWRAVESMVSFTRSGSSCSRLLLSPGGFGPAILAVQDVRRLDRSISCCLILYCSWL